MTHTVKVTTTGGRTLTARFPNESWAQDYINRARMMATVTKIEHTTE